MGSLVGWTLEELRALVEQAHARDKRVHVHAHAQPGLANAIAAGCDVILHGALIDEDALAGMAGRGLWYMPTLHITSEKARAGRNWPAYMAERMKAAHPVHCAGVAKDGVIQATGDFDPIRATLSAAPAVRARPRRAPRRPVLCQ